MNGQMKELKNLRRLQDVKMNRAYDFKLTPGYCLYNGVGVFSQNGSSIKFLIENPENSVLKERLKRAFENYLELIQKYDDCPEAYKNELKVKFVAATRAQIRKCVSSLYSFAGSVRIQNNSAEQNESEKKGGDSSEKKDAAAVLLLDTILDEALRLGATDIHIENKIVRFRINGRLQKFQSLQSSVYVELVQRIKLLGDMNVMEKRRCQDGHFCWGKNNNVFVRVSTACVVSSNYVAEESVVMRLLDTKRVPLLIEKLGFNECQIEKISYLKEMKNGLILVCGPTGAGKSTTVASILMEIDRACNHSKKIVSLEEPPEYYLPGVTQFQINQHEGLSYEEALSHVFRQDPDVIMIGEIRDENGAGAAVRAALTGHLVFATLHTGGVGEAVLRMANLGISKKVLASVLNGVIVQDLNFVDDLYSRKENSESLDVSGADGKVDAGMYSRPELHADIGLPGEKMDLYIEEFSGESEIDRLFAHYTNYSDVFANTKERLNKRYIAENFSVSAAKKIKRSKKVC